MRLSIIFILILIFTVATFSQESFKSDKATVYVYSLGAGATLGRVQPMVFLDNKEIAQIRPSRYFIALISPGKHELHFKKSKKNGGVAMDFKTGEVYYLRVKWQAGANLRPESFEIVPEENANYDLKQIKPVDKSNLKNKDVAFIKLPE